MAQHILASNTPNKATPPAPAKRSSRPGRADRPQQGPEGPNRNARPFEIQEEKALCLTPHVGARQTEKTKRATLFQQDRPAGQGASSSAGWNRTGISAVWALCPLSCSQRLYIEPASAGLLLCRDREAQSLTYLPLHSSVKNVSGPFAVCDMRRRINSIEFSLWNSSSHYQWIEFEFNFQKWSGVISLTRSSRLTCFFSFDACS